MFDKGARMCVDKRGFSSTLMSTFFRFSVVLTVDTLFFGLLHTLTVEQSLSINLSIIPWTSSVTSEKRVQNC